MLRTLAVGGHALVLGHGEGSLDALHARERSLLSPRATVARARDFVGGRLAAKAALAARFGAGEWIIERATGEHEGAPIVHGPAQASVSISHTDGFAIAIAGPAPAAIDLVKLEPLPESLCEEAFTSAERRAWALSGEPLAMTVAFAAKEAALKWLRVGMGTPLHSVRVMPRRYDAIDVETDALRATLRACTLTHDAWLAFVLLERSPS
ncbi:MAG: 4'-phosphopantetheinyl transferase superfamily protein [Deltaproteobacteria bacterium]|nr:4'-phosphopantetheinyl transferase superfamily protein [Deltaproteobacteria bacterium]